MNKIIFKAFLISIIGGITMSTHAQSVPPLFAPPGMQTNDNWFAKSGDTYHAFYLQVPKCLGPLLNVWGDARVYWEHVGHATSQDLVHWTDCGPVVVAAKGTWNDISIATGSVVQHDGRWWMIFTARGGKVSGVGLAVSDDLYNWERVGDGPVAPLGVAMDATWEGQPVQWVGLADPYLYPEAIDGWYYMIINSHIVGAPIEQAGCLTTMRSRDLITWEPDRVLTWPKLFERLETPQLWTRNGRWYLYFGGAHDHGITDTYLDQVPEEVAAFGIRVNGVFTADAFEGPYQLNGKWWFTLPDGRYGYIHKVMPGPDGEDVLLTSDAACISRAYPVSYADDGTIELSLPAVPAP